MISVRAFFKEDLVFPRHLRRHDLDHQPVFEPELDDMGKRLTAPDAAAEAINAIRRAS
jgi:hypothetical protein